MGLFSKLFKKSINIADPIGHQIRKSYGSKENTPRAFLDPGYAFGGRPMQQPPGAQPVDRSLRPDPGTGGQTVHLGGGGGGGYTYQQNPFAQQMAQVNAIRSGPQPQSIGMFNGRPAMAGQANMNSPIYKAILGSMQQSVAPQKQVQHYAPSASKHMMF